MKRISFLMVCAAIIGISLSMAVGFAVAAEKIIDTTADQVTVALDKNGNEYVRVIVSEPKTLQGISYTAQTAVMCFGSTVEEAKTLQEGDPIKAIVSEQEWKGRTSYTLVQLIK